jgi:acetylornithine/succinyldiaminopimelate/putrescine aminotransferase
MHLMVYGEFVLSPQVLLAQKLASLLPPSLDTSYFVNSGAEAVEGALKLSKRATARQGIVAFRNAYHGSTHGPLSLFSDENYKRPFLPLLPAVTLLDLNRWEGLKAITEYTACVIVEPVRGEAGYEVPDIGFLSALREACDRTGALLVFDEIQCGMGRTGKMFAFRHEGVIPDVLVLGKALGAGMPIGAFIASNALMSKLSHDPVLGHMTTFGGHPVVCAAALAGIDELEKNSWVNQVPAKEQIFREHLRHPRIRTISGRGLMLAADIGSFDLNQQLIDRCIKDGVISDWFLFAPGRLRIAPPLTISGEEIAHACSVIVRNLDML